MLTLKASVDGGKKWTAGYTLWEGPTAYSDLVMLDDTNIGVLYENGDSKSYERISFKTVKVTNCL
jgi:sialidase-1